MTSKEFIQIYGDKAINACLGSGLLPSVMIAQAILEGAWGKSYLARAHNNHFGIKAPKNAANKVQLTTSEVSATGETYTTKAWFKTYESILEGFQDRVEWLKMNPRYTTHGVFEARTARQQVEALAKAGYATDPKYASKLNELISSYKLEMLDVAMEKKSRDGN